MARRDLRRPGPVNTRIALDAALKALYAAVGGPANSV
ncbi:hypothetical protein DEDE109153_18135 [Deinococcus deserti]